MFVEVTVYRHRHVVAYAEHRPERVCTHTEVRMLAQELHCVTFLLQGIVGTAGTQDLNLAALQLHALTFALALDQFSVHTYARSGGYILYYGVVELLHIDDNLYILDSRTIVQGDEINSLTTTAGPYPAFHIDNSTIIGTLQYIYDFSSFHLYLNNEQRLTPHLCYSCLLSLTRTLPCAASPLPSP